MASARIGCALLVLSFAWSAQANESVVALEQKTSAAIHSACHGYAIDMIPDLLSFARDWLNEKSPICKDLREQGYDYDVGSTLKRHHIAFTEEDSRRIDKLYDAWRFQDMNLQMECNSEYMCMRVRKELQEKKIPIAQNQYQQVADYCEQTLAPYNCIENWFRDEWTAKGNRNPPVAQKQAVSKLGFDQLMQDSPSVKKHTSSGSGGLNLDELMGSSSSQSGNLDQASGSGASSANSGEIGFGDIYSARAEIKITRSQDDLKQKNQKIAGRCQCTLDGVSCFESGNYQHQQLNTSMIQADDNYEAQQRNVCGEWASNLRGRSADQTEALTGLHRNTDIVLANLDKLAANYQKIVKGLQDKQSKIDVAAKKRQQQQQQQQQAAASNALFGKILAIGVTGLVAAGSDLPTDQAMDIFGAVTQDILNETGGTNILALTQDLQIENLDLQSINSVTNTALNSGAGNGSSGSLTLTCKADGICSEFRFSSSKDRNSFAKQCPQVVKGSCPAGPACSHSEGGRTQKSFVYSKSAADVKRLCKQSQGKFSG